MGTDMYGQGAALNESLLAAFMGAEVRSFVGMDTEMALKVRFAIKTL